MSYLLHLIRVLTTPSCWIRNRSTNKIWDREINLQLNNPTFTEVGNATCRLNGQAIWTENYPYDSFTDRETGISGMPSTKTVFRFNDILDKHKMAGSQS